jgi:hypothetical protein
MDKQWRGKGDWIVLMKQAGNITLLHFSGAAASRVKAADKPYASLIAVDPARVRVWPGNPHRYGRLNSTNCRDLINAMIETGGSSFSQDGCGGQDDARPG